MEDSRLFSTALDFLVQPNFLKGCPYLIADPGEERHIVRGEPARGVAGHNHHTKQCFSQAERHPNESLVFLTH